MIIYSANQARNGRYKQALQYSIRDIELFEPQLEHPKDQQSYWMSVEYKKSYLDSMFFL